MVTKTQFLAYDSIPWAYLTPSPPLYWPNSSQPHPRNPHLPKSPLNRFFIGLTRLRTSMHVCRQQCMRFILHTRQFKDFLKMSSKLNDDEYDRFYKPNVSVYFVLKVLQWWIYWHRLHQFANCAEDKFLRMRRKYWGEVDPLKDWANHPRTNSGECFFML